MIIIFPEWNMLAYQCLANVRGQAFLHQERRSRRMTQTLAGLSPKLGVKAVVSAFQDDPCQECWMLWSSISRTLGVFSKLVGVPKKPKMPWRHSIGVQNPFCASPANAEGRQGRPEGHRMPGRQPRVVPNAKVMGKSSGIIIYNLE